MCVTESPIPVNYFTFSPPHIVQEADSSDRAWDSWGVRDIAPLVDRSGNWLCNNDIQSFYYTGSSITSRGAIQSSGLAHFNITTGALTRYSDPVLSGVPGSWSDEICCTPWVFYHQSTYFMYFRGAKKSGIAEGIGLATSVDGRTFSNHSANPIIKCTDFAGLQQNPSLTGVISVIYSIDRYILLFEGYEAHYDRCGQIFAAESHDGVHFTPMNAGQPVFTGRHVRSWPIRGVCNPRLLYLDNGWFMLGFNGTNHGEYAIGLAYTRDFVTWYEHPQNPLLVPRGWPADDPFSYRLEGPVFDRQALLRGDMQVRCFFMAIPLNAQNHERSVNAMTIASRCAAPLGISTYMRALPKFHASLQVYQNYCILDSRNEPNQVICAYFINQSSSNKLTLNIQQISSYSDQSALYITRSNVFAGLSRGAGTSLKIYRGYLMIRKKSYALRIKTLIYRINNVVRRKLYKKLHVPLSLAPSTEWSQVLLLSDQSWPLTINCTRTGWIITQSSTNKPVVINDHAHPTDRIISLTVDRGASHIALNHQL